MCFHNFKSIIFFIQNSLKYRDFKKHVKSVLSPINIEIHTVLPSLLKKYKVKSIININSNKIFQTTSVHLKVKRIWTRYSKYSNFLSGMGISKCLGFLQFRPEEGVHEIMKVLMTFAACYSCNLKILEVLNATFSLILRNTYWGCCSTLSSLSLVSHPLIYLGGSMGLIKIANVKIIKCDQYSKITSLRFITTHEISKMRKMAR